MNNLLTTKVTFAPSITCAPDELRPVTLGEVLLSGKWAPAVEGVRAEADPDKSKELKKRLPAFMPGGIFTDRVAESLEEPSGYISVDLDEKDNQDVADFASLKELIRAIPCISYCGLSARGKGFFCLIPIADPAKHSEYFKALIQDFARCGLTIDKQCGNINRLRFVSYDPEPYINTGAELYDHTLPKRTEARPATAPGAPAQADAETTADVLKAVALIEERKWDITGGYGQWTEILMAIANTFGEEGRDIAHRISALAKGIYTPEETDCKYSSFLKHPEYAYKIGTFFHYVKQAQIQHEFDNFTDDDL